MLIEKLASVKRYVRAGKYSGICSAGKKLQRMKKKRIDKIIKMWYSIGIRFKTWMTDHENTIDEAIFIGVYCGALPRYRSALVNMAFFIEAMNGNINSL